MFEEHEGRDGGASGGVPSVCDRIAFARGSRGNRTARKPSGEHGGKTRRQQPVGYFLRSILLATISEIAPISCNCQGNLGGFLRMADCVAEREGFEPSIQVLARITV